MSSNQHGTLLEGGVVELQNKAEDLGHREADLMDPSEISVALCKAHKKAAVLRQQMCQQVEHFQQSRAEMESALSTSRQRETKLRSDLLALQKQAITREGEVTIALGKAQGEAKASSLSEAKLRKDMDESLQKAKEDMQQMD